MELEPKFVGATGSAVQVDESFFSGRRKNNKRRLRHGDRKQKNDDDELEDWNQLQHNGAV